MNVRIRPLVVEDAYISVKWRNDPEVFKFTGNTYDHTITIDSELDWIKRVINNKNEYRCAIIVDEKYVGNIYITDIQNNIGEYHIFIGDKSYWGKGVAKKASLLIIEYGFNVLGLNEIKLWVRKENKSAINLYNSLGFKIIPRQKEANMIEMALTRLIGSAKFELSQKI